ncbi:hypothetical protein GP486_005760 [Trichoglossum hirsutum]|uniref:Amino acid transporter n=1 Tax=Trichoglossum hirsutum TaxID=265104 RepID=A0A9P8RM14_9PEZI|nr:hypothetical protein GP486_005760 [Trichoglossum hirsutum]
MADENEPVGDGITALDTLTREQLEQAAAKYNEDKQRFDVAPTAKQLLGPFTVFCLVLNRTIGSGIFTVPPKVLSGTGSVGAALIIWSFSGIIVMCGLLCWLELGLSIPFHLISEDGTMRKVSTPRSGGEKNFLEYIFKKPPFFITSVYGIMFIILGNISGNAVAFGIYVLIAAGCDPISDPLQRGPVIGLAIGALTVCASLHIFSRRGGILVNNMFAVVKVAMLLVIAILGFVHAGRTHLQSSGINESLDSTLNITNQNITSAMINTAMRHNFDLDMSFSHPRHDVGSYVDSFLVVIYSYTGFEQPFYVLSEVARPRRVFPMYTLLGMTTAVLLYVLVNVSYLCVVPKEAYTTIPMNTIDMAGAFFHDIFDSTNGDHMARRVMSGLIAVSIFGNILVLTFTAARVKQEIAKEGILPFSLFFATGHTTPWAWLQSRWRRESNMPTALKPGDIDIDDHLEQSPMAALTLHWFTSVLLIAVTSMLRPTTAYSFLISLYSYVNVSVIGFLVAGGLLYLKLDSYLRGCMGRNWVNKVSFKPWLDPLHAVVYFFAMGFFLFAAFAKPTKGSPYVKDIVGYWWFLVPAIGLSSLLWGMVWWLGLKGIEWNRRRRLDVRRTPYIEKDGDGNYVQKVELVEHEWLAVVDSELHEMT